MRTIYIDSDFKCHVSNPDNSFTLVNTNFFDNKCDTYIEGYRFVPEGYVWTRDDGTIFHGEMIAPWKDYDLLFVAQHNYEYEQLTKENENLVNSIAELTEIIYKNDLTVME